MTMIERSTKSFKAEWTTPQIVDCDGDHHHIESGAGQNTDDFGGGTTS